MKVSVCIPAYKQVETLERCLDSILMQEFFDYEIVITDDSPDDEVKSFVARYDDKRIRYFQNRPALGSPRNWDEGFRRAKGEYLKIMHHDDWFSTPQSLGHFVSLLDNNPEADIAFAGSCDIRGNGKKIAHVVTDEFLEKIREQPETIILANHIGAPSVMIFRNKGDLFFDEKLKWVVDVDLYCRAIKNNPKFAYSKDVLVNIGIGEHQTTSRFKKNFKPAIGEMFYVADKFDLYERQPSYRESIVKALGKEGIFLNSSLTEHFSDEEFVFSSEEARTAFWYYVRKCIRSLTNN